MIVIDYDHLLDLLASISVHISGGVWETTGEWLQDS